MAAIAALREPFDSHDAVAAQIARSLSTDPVALGSSAPCARLRNGSLRWWRSSSAPRCRRASAGPSSRCWALGLSSGQLSRWLWLENGSLVLASLV
jgi:hypothetical protein